MFRMQLILTAVVALVVVLVFSLVVLTAIPTHAQVLPPVSSTHFLNTEYLLFYLG